MSEAQFVTILFVAPFATLTVAWFIGLAVLERSERKAIRAIDMEKELAELKKRLHQ